MINRAGQPPLSEKLKEAIGLSKTAKMAFPPINTLKALLKVTIFLRSVRLHFESQ